MQSLGRKIVNFLGMTTLGNKNINQSLSIVPSNEFMSTFLGQKTAANSVSVAFATDATPPGFVLKSGYQAYQGGFNLAASMDSENGEGTLSSIVPLLVSWQEANFIQPDSEATISRFFNGSDPQFPETIYILIPFGDNGLRNVSIVIKNSLTSSGNPVAVTAIGTGLINYGRNLLNQTNFMSDNHSATLFSPTPFTGSFRYAASNNAGGAFAGILLKVEPVLQADDGYWTLLVAENNL